MQVTQTSFSQSEHGPYSLAHSRELQQLIQRLLAAWPTPIDARASHQADSEGLPLDKVMQLQDAGLVMIEWIDYSCAESVWLKDVVLTAKGKSLVAGKGLFRG